MRWVGLPGILENVASLSVAFRSLATSGGGGWDSGPPCGGTKRRGDGWPGCGSPTAPAARSSGSRRPTPSGTSTSSWRCGRSHWTRNPSDPPGDVRRGASTPGSRTAARTWRRPAAPATPGPSRPNTVTNARQLLATSVRPVIGKLWVERTSTERLEKLFADMAKQGYATSTVDRTWNYLNQALQHGLRHRRIKVNPAADVLLPAAPAVRSPARASPSTRRSACWWKRSRPTVARRCGSPASCAVCARASWPACAGRSSTSTPTHQTSTSSSGRSRSTTSTPARWRPRRSGVDAVSAFTHSWSPPCGATATRCASSASTRTRDSCSAPATAPR